MDFRGASDDMLPRMNIMGIGETFEAICRTGVSEVFRLGKGPRPSTQDPTGR